MSSAKKKAWSTRAKFRLTCLLLVAIIWGFAASEDGGDTGTGWLGTPNGGHPDDGCINESGDDDEQGDEDDHDHVQEDEDDEDCDEDDPILQAPFPWTDDDPRVIPSCVKITVYPHTPQYAAQPNSIDWTHPWRPSQLTACPTYNPNLPTVLIVAGYITGDYPNRLMRAYRRSFGTNHNIVVISIWPEFPYTTSYESLTGYAAEIGKRLGSLYCNVFFGSLGANPANLHLITMDLGAVFAATFARTVKTWIEDRELTREMKAVGRITVLNPAPPNCTRDKSEQTVLVPLNDRDATVLDLIHTANKRICCLFAVNWKVKPLSHDFYGRVGTISTMDDPYDATSGGINFFPNGGIIQHRIKLNSNDMNPTNGPCGRIHNVLNSFHLAVDYFAESISQTIKTKFYSEKCNNYSEFLKKECGHKLQLIMGANLPMTPNYGTLTKPFKLEEIKMYLNL